MAAARDVEDADFDKLSEAELMALAAGGSAEMAAGMMRGADGTIEKSAAVLEGEENQTRFEAERQALSDALTAVAQELTHDQTVAERSSDDEGENEEVDAEGMGQPCGTVESTWGGEASEWVLEKIVRRRQSAHRGDRVHSEESDNEDAAWEYCCVWRGHGEAPTWERRGFLRDLGYGREVTAYDAEHKAHYRKTSRLRPQKPPRSQLDEQEKRKAEKMLRRSVAATVAMFAEQISTVTHRYLDPIIAKFIDFNRDTRYVQLCDGREAAALVLKIIADVNTTGAYVESIKFVHPPVLRTVINNVTHSKVKMLYHGTTTSRAAKAIAAIGLVVPGQGNNVKVANGSAFGVGIYTADTPATPVGYARDGDLFVCVGLTQRSTSVTATPQGWYVFAERELVAPFLHLRISRSFPPRANFDVSMIPYSGLPSFSAPVVFL
jgi:hypothetical protein